MMSVPFQCGSSILLPDMTVDSLSTIIKDALQSESFDAKGEKNGYPLFERYEDRIRSSIGLQGIIPQLTYLLKRKMAPEISVVREIKYPLSNCRCDIVLKHASGQELWIELKQHWTKGCTPFETVFSANDYRNDIRKFNKLSENTKKAILLLVFRNNDSFPEYPAREINNLLGDTSFAWKPMDMPTKEYGPCICHILLWQVPPKLQTSGDQNMDIVKNVHSGMMGDELQKSKAIDALVPYLDQFCLGSGGIYRPPEPEQGKRPAYYGYFLQKRRMGWVLVCWSDQFEDAFGGTSYWIELEERPSRRLPSKYEKEVKPHPSKPGRFIIPVLSSEMKDPEKVASRAFQIAYDTMM